MTYSIFFSANNSFSQHLNVCLISLLENTKNKNISIYIIDFWISEENKEKISRSLIKYKNRSLQYASPNINYLKWVLIKNYTIETYARLLIPHMVNIDTCIYSDCDVVFNGDVFDSYKYFNKKYSIWAVLEPIWVEHYKNKLKIPYDIWYFNWWLLLLNLNKIRKEKSFEKVLDYLKKRDDILFADQDWLNAIFYNDRYHLPPKFNTMITVSLSRKYSDTLYSKLEYEECKKNPAMIHFNGNLKPRKWNCFYNWSSIYLKLLKKTEFYQLDDINIKEKILFCLKTYFIDYLPDYLYNYIISLWRKNL